jgi:hypothetical protein
MEHCKTPTSNTTMIDASNNNNSYRNHQKKKRTTTKRQQLPSPSLTHKHHQHIPSVIITEPNSNQSKTYVYETLKQDEYIPMKNPLGWTKKWTKWFSSCGSERVSQTNLNTSIEVSFKLFILKLAPVQ